MNELRSGAEAGSNDTDSQAEELTQGKGEWIQFLMRLAPKWIRERWYAGSILRDSGIITAGAGAGQAVLLAASPVLTRLYTPDHFGILAVYASGLTIILVVASLRWELAIPLPEHDGIAVNILVLAFGSLLVVSGLCAVASLTFGPDVARRLGFAKFAPMVWVLPVGVALGGSYQILNYWAIRREDYAEIGKSKLVQNLGEAVTQVVLGVAGSGPIGLLVGDVVGRFGGSSGLIRPLLTRDRKLVRRVRARRLKVLAARFRRFPLVASGASLVNSAGAQLPPILLAGAYGSAEAGLFAVAFRVVAAPSALIGRGISQVYMGRASRLVGSDHAEMKRLVRRVCQGMLLLGIIPAFVLAVVGVPLFTFVFGQNWTTAGNFVRPLSLVLVARLVAGPVSQTLNILERQGTQLVWDVARLFLVVVAILVPATLGAGPETAVVLYSMVTSVMYGTLVLMAFWFIDAEGQK